MKSCCVCKDSRQDAILHRFPRTKRILKLWLKCINREDLNKLSSKEISKRFVCQKHFQNKFITESTSHLSMNAYPSLFTAEEISSGKPSKYATVLSHDDFGNEMIKPGKGNRETGEEPLEDGERPDKFDDGIDKDNQDVNIELPLFQALNLNTLDLQSVCRGCLSANNGELYTVLVQNDNKDGIMFSEITSIHVNEEDKLPNALCASCRQKVFDCYEFKTMCLKSNNILKSLLDSAESKINKRDDLSNSSEFTVASNIMNEIAENNDFENLDDVIQSDEEALCIVQENSNNLDLVILDKAKQGGLSKNKHYKNILTKASKQKQYECSQCPKKFHKSKSLADHIKKHHDSNRTHSCGQCPDRFTCEDDLKLHESLHNKDSVWKCNKCQKVFSVRAALRRHLQRHMSEKRHACDVCGKRFAERYAVARHRPVHTGDRPPNRYECHACPKRFPTERALSAHSAVHNGGAAMCACACGKRFASRRLLASHRRVHTDDKPYQCRYCDKRFRHENARTTHHRTHTGERPYVCCVCGKAFIQTSNLTMHMRSHTGERPYACSKCSSKFSTSSALKVHERTHTGERPYSCDICGKRFARQNVRVHMRVHTGERPFACAACPKRFHNVSHLREHNRLHTGERPYECAMCTQKFTTKSHLIKHVRHHEKKKTKPGVVTYRPYKMKAEEPNEILIVEENQFKDNELNVIGIQETPMVAQELILPSELDDRTDVIVLNNSENAPESYIDVNFTNDMNLVAVNEGEVSISAASATVEGTTVKLYQLDQSLLQIHSTPGQLTISKITSKMTANF